MLHVFLRNFITGYIFRRHSSNLHSYILKACFDVVIHNVCISHYENSDTSAAVDVRYNASVVSSNFLKSSDVKVFSDHCDFLYESVFYSFCCICCPSFCHERIHICRFGINDLIYNCLYKSLKFIVLCNEVCLRVYFYDCSFVVFYNCFYNTFRCDSSSFFLSFCLSVLSEEFYCRIHISVCFRESFFTVHHSRSGHFS